MGKPFLFFALLLFLFPDDAFSWGPGIHAMISSSLCTASEIISPLLKLISNFQKEFIWGSLMADMVIGKNLSNWAVHPHNWDFVFKIFEDAKTDKLKAFMIGYMTHLSHDVVAHNFLIPEMVILEALTKKNVLHEKNLLHLKIEINAENLVHIDVWKKIKDIQDTEDIRVCSEFIEDRLKSGLLSPKFSSIIFRRTIKVNAFKEFIRSKIRFNGDSKGKDVVIELVQGYVEMAYRSSENFLKRFDKSFCVKVDPTGMEPIGVSFALLNSIREIKKKKGIVDERKFFSALRHFQPSIFGKRTPVLDILNIS